MNQVQLVDPVNRSRVLFSLSFFSSSPRARCAALNAAYKVAASQGVVAHACGHRFVTVSA